MINFLHASRTSILLRQASYTPEDTITGYYTALGLAAQCIVFGPVCEFVCGFVGVCLVMGVSILLCLFVCGSVTTITRNCVHRSSPN